MGVKNFSFEYC